VSLPKPANGRVATCSVAICSTQLLHVLSTTWSPMRTLIIDDNVRLLRNWSCKVQLRGGTGAARTYSAHLMRTLRETTRIGGVRVHRCCRT
jgi:hypothetical protein